MSQLTDWKSKGENIVHDFLKSKKNSNSLLELEDLLLVSFYIITLLKLLELIEFS